MQTKRTISLTRKTLYGIVLLAVFLSASGRRTMLSVDAQAATAVASDYILSDGQFVYGPNIGDFNVKTWLEANAPDLLPYAEDLYGRSEYYSINPKIYLTLLEMHSQLISTPRSELKDPFGLTKDGFISQIEYLSEIMTEAYYLHLYSYSPLPVSQRSLKPFITPGGITLKAAPDTNARTYAIIAGLAALDVTINTPTLFITSVCTRDAENMFKGYLEVFPNSPKAEEVDYMRAYSF